MKHKEIVLASTRDGIVDLSMYRYYRLEHGPSIGEPIKPKKIKTDKERVKAVQTEQALW